MIVLFDKSCEETVALKEDTVGEHVAQDTREEPPIQGGYVL